MFVGEEVRESESRESPKRWIKKGIKVFPTMGDLDGVKMKSKSLEDLMY